MGGIFWGKGQRQGLAAGAGTCLQLCVWGGAWLCLKSLPFGVEGQGCCMVWWVVLRAHDPRQPSLGAPSPHLGGLGPCWGSLFRAALTVACPGARSPAGNPPNAPVLPSAAGWGFASSGSTQRHLQGDDVAAPCGQAASPDCFLGHRSRQLNPGDRQQPLPDPAAVPKRPDLALSRLLLCSK